MNSESNGQHIIFITILALILFFSYHAIPQIEPVKSKYKISKKIQAESSLAENGGAQTAHEGEDGTASDGETPETLEANTEELSAPPVEAAEVTQKAASAMEPKKTLAQIDIIPMNNPLYASHKKGIVQFTHKKHVEDYSIGCGDCHHDEKGKPLELTADDTTQGCIECHKGTKKPKGEKLGAKEKIAKYHFEALHANCISCHKAYNIEKGDPKGKKPAPTSCAKCHPKTKA